MNLIFFLKIVLAEASVIFLLLFFSTIFISAYLLHECSQCAHESVHLIPGRRLEALCLCVDDDWDVISVTPT